MKFLLILAVPAVNALGVAAYAFAAFPSFAMSGYPPHP